MRALYLPSRSLSSLAAALLVLTAALATSPARADLDIAAVVNLGGGLGTGEANNNPYSFQVGGALELVLSDFVLGARITQSYGSLVDCSAPCGPSAPAQLRAIGGDLGYEMDLSLVHLSPRFGFGRVRDDDFKAAYLEPGAVVDVELGWFLVGVDLRYRIVIGEPYTNGFMGFARVGARF